MSCTGLEQLEHTPGEVALQATSDLTVRLALRPPAFDVALRLIVTSPTDEHRTVEGAVELAVTGSVEPVADRLARRCGDRRDAGQGGERGLGAYPPWVRPGTHYLGRIDWPDACFIEERRDKLADAGLDFRIEFFDLVVKLLLFPALVR